MNVNIELTDHCNLRCRMCSQSLRAHAHGVPKRFMDWETWRAALRGLARVPEDVHLCPHWLGEPTLHPAFDAMVAYAFSLNWENRLFRTFKLHTNGVLVPPDRSWRLVRLACLPGQRPDTFATVHWSVDAFFRETYRVVKGADLRDQVYANLDAFLRIRDQHASGPRAHVALVVQPENADEATRFVDHWGSRLAQGWCLARDWPPQDRDAIYLRVLHCQDQERAAALHAQVCDRLGLSQAPAVATESF